MYDMSYMIMYLYVSVRLTNQIPHEKNKPSIQLNFFLKGFTLVIIDCSRQNESVKSGTVDVQLKFEFKEYVSANTTAYCRVIHDHVIEYSPIKCSTQDYVNYHRQKIASLSF